MDKFTKPRKLTRSSVTRICNKTETEISKENADTYLILSYREDLRRLLDTIETQDQSVINFMLEQNTEEEDLEKEVEGT